MVDSESGREKPSSLQDLTNNILAMLDLAAAEVALDHAQRTAQQTEAEHDPKDAARRTIKSACVAAEQRFSRSGGNPVHAWAAIMMCTSPNVSPMPLPAWCTPYLHEVAKGLLEARGDGEQLAAFVTRELGFVKSGWSAVKDNASASRATAAALLYDHLCHDGHTATQAYEAVRSSEGFAEVASARKLVKKGKAMLGHTPLSAIDEADE